MQINLEFRHFLFLVISIIVVAGTSLVVGYGGSNPSNMGHTIGEIEGFEGFCVFSPTKTDCPDGWTRAASMHDRTIRGADTPGGIGGNGTHYHNITEWGAYEGVDTSPSTVPVYLVWKSDATSSWPPYMNVTICCKD